MNQPKFALVISGVAHEVFAMLHRLVYPPPMVGKVVCSWCGKLMGYKEGMDGQTNGICPPCAERELAKLEEAKEKDE